MTVTIVQVAIEAKTSPATVSRVLNNSAGVRPAIRQQVLAAIERLHYQPNRNARALVTNHTGMFGLVVADVANPFFPELIKGVEHAASAHQYSVLLCNTEECADREYHLLEFLQRQVDCIILAGSRMTDAQLLQLNEQLHIPLVLINRCVPAAVFSAVYTDTTSAMNNAIHHLYGQRHSAIAYVAGPSTSWSNNEREASYRSAMEAHCLNPLVIHSDKPTMEAGFRVAHTLIDAKPPCPTAVIAYNDLLAIGIQRALLQAGRTVPEDFSIIGIDNIALAGLIEPTLTSIEQPKYELGATAVALALEQILTKQESSHNKQIGLDAQLIIRTSSLCSTNAPTALY